MMSLESSLGRSRLRSPPYFWKVSHLKTFILSLFRKIFHSTGGYIFDNPKQFILGSLILAGVMGLSFFTITFETGADRLYALPASQARSDLAKQKALFGDPPRISMVFIVHRNDSNTLTKSTLSKLEKMDDFIYHKLGIVQDEPFNKDIVHFEDICYRQIIKFGNSSEAPACTSMTPLDLYRSPKMYGTPIATRNWPYLVNLQKNKIVKADLALTDPAIQRNPTGTTKLFNATGALMLYHTSSQSETMKKSLAWEKSLVDFINHDVKPFSASSNLSSKPTTFLYPEYTDHDWTDFKVFVNAERSWQDELGRSTMFDAKLIRDYILAFVIIAAYMVIFNRTSNLIRSKSVCGFLGAVSALLGYVVGGGICYWYGLKHTPTMHASPFLVLAIGLDNTFVVLNFYTLGYGQTDKPRDRCQAALTDSGLALFITTFTSILSFAVGAFGPYTAVRNFCIQTAMGLAGGFIYNIIFFYPFLCLEAKAEADGRIFFLPNKYLKRLPITYTTTETQRLLRTLHGRPETAPGDPYETTTIASPNFDPVSLTPTPMPLTIDVTSVEPIGSWHPTDVTLRSETRLCSLRHEFLGKKSMFEIASIQWALEHRGKEIKREIRGRQNEILVSPQISQTNVMDASLNTLTNSELDKARRITSLGVALTEEPRGNKGKKSRRILLSTIGPLLVNSYAQITMLTLMILYLVYMGYVAITNLTAGLELENLTPPDSYLREAFAVSHDKFPIFPQQTFVMFTAPENVDRRVLQRFSKQTYGVRPTESKLEALLGVVNGVKSSDIHEYMETLGEVPWWEASTFLSLLELDRRLRNMEEVQDVLNGMMYFYQESGNKFLNATTSEDRKKLFYKSLLQWLRLGVIGQHTRDQFVFDVEKTKPLVELYDESIPQLLSFRLMIFNYNFLNSYSQSKYMLKLRTMMKDFSEPWGSGVNAKYSTNKLEEHFNSFDAPRPKYDEIAKKNAGVVAQSMDHSNFTVQCFMDTFLYFETDATIWSSTLLNMATAFISIILASSVLMKGTTNVILVTAMICAVDIGVFGGMALAGIQLNILSMILLVLSIGFSVDYTVHVIHTFCHTLGKTPRDRAVETLILICNPVTHGAISTLLGILPIYFRKEFIMQNFFNMMALVITFGFLNGVVFLPIILSRTGTLLDHSSSERDQLHKTTKELMDSLANYKPIL